VGASTSGGQTTAREPQAGLPECKNRMLKHL